VVAAALFTKSPRASFPSGETRQPAPNFWCQCLKNGAKNADSEVGVFVKDRGADERFEKWKRLPAPDWPGLGLLARVARDVAGLPQRGTQFGVHLLQGPGNAGEPSRRPGRRRRRPPH
jgi:hypothetical protein